ncbi:hypothetical protein ABL78_0207 [Leptomonas seymouri]|uniref:Uncharacterized protein n=1 Tax=Leptomonas seymouri TaxID=5684 RepID=A0A0N1IML1_LEPSE|nr:hypothetical protein ABL78_0207 [Leptomonas seymouri]|eukprot:KPI90611.1 hypothetical protein ABL78_0207 [Leptomonas seymouri]
MGALPSRESHEGPNTIYFGNNTGVVTFRLPLTPHYFPSADCLAFEEVHRARNSQSCKYSFNIREASAVLPEVAAREFKLAQEEYWGPEAEAGDPSLHYHDAEVQARLVQNGFSPTEQQQQQQPKEDTASSQHIRRSFESRHELYQKIVVDPTKDALVDTDEDMRQLFLQEQRWRAARDVVRRHRSYLRQQRMTELEKSQLDTSEVVDTDVGVAELEAAEAVPPPRRWLRPIPEVVIERMSMEDACAAHRAYRERHGGSATVQTQQQQQSLSSKIDIHFTDIGTPTDSREMNCSPTHPRRKGSQYEEGALSALGTGTEGRQPFVKSDALNEEMLKSYPSFQDSNLPFEMDERYMDGRVHMVAHEGVNYLFAYNPEYLRGMGKTVVVDGSLVEERRRQSGAVQSERCRQPFTTTYTVATRQAEDFDDPNQRRAYEILQPVYAKYYVPVIPVRVLGVDGFIPCGVDEDGHRRDNSSGSAELRGAPWMRGLDDDEVEEDYQERVMPQMYGVSPPPVLRACRFIHSTIGDKVLNRMSVLGCVTFRERCINAGLPDAIACPLWGVAAVSDVPQLQLQREIELRLLASIHEIDDGDMRIRDALARQHRWNDYISFTNSPMYGFMVSAPPERRFRAGADGKLREVGGAADDDVGTCASNSGNDCDKDEEQQQREGRSNRNGKGGAAALTRSPAKARAQLAPKREAEKGAVTDPSNSHREGNHDGSLTCPALELSLAGATSSPSSDTEGRDGQSSGTSARSAGHGTLITTTGHASIENDGLNVPTSTDAASRKPMAGCDSNAARVKRTREGQNCTDDFASPETTVQGAALQAAMANEGLPQSSAAATAVYTEDKHQVEDDDDIMLCLRDPPSQLSCAWSFKRRRLGTAEEFIVNPNFSGEEWMPMVNPLTKDVALASMGIRVSIRGRLFLMRYSGSAVQKVLYYLSQASAPIFCLPYVGPQQKCSNVFLENVLRLPKEVTVKSAPQSRPPPPTTEQIRSAMAAYTHGRVGCYVYVDLDDRAANPPTSCIRNHYREDALMERAIEVGITSKLILSQIPIKADVRSALAWYRKSLQHGPPPADGAADQEGENSPYAAWPTLLDAPAPCDGDVLVVCPRTHRWIRVTTFVLLTALLLVHKKYRDKAEELIQPVPVLDLYTGEHFASEVEIFYEALVHKNIDSEGVQWYMLHMRSFFSFNGIVELLLDRLRSIVDLEKCEDKDDEGWLVLHQPPTPAGEALPAPNFSLTSSPAPAINTTAKVAASATLRTNFGAAAFAGMTYMESGSYLIWSFLLMGQRFFFGKKPRFLHIAAQRQRQNQRRRLKRKERDVVTRAGGAADPAAASVRTVATNATATGTTAILSHVSSSTPVHQEGAHVHANERMPITAADEVQMAHDTLHPSSYPQQQRHAPRHLDAEDRLHDDELHEIRECCRRHRQWMQSRSAFVAPVSAGAHLPLSPTFDASKWALPPLAGQTSCRHRLCVPIAPQSVGPLRCVSCGHPASGASGIKASASPTEANEESGAVPMEKPVSPRVVDAQKGSFRWDPYRVGE